MRPDGTDRGSATVWLAGFVALIGLVTVAGVLQATALIGRHRAEAAADFAALAAATAVATGEQDACTTARELAERNGARLTGCVLVGADVEVSVATPVRFGRFGVRDATARARAGPADRTVAGQAGGVGGGGAPPPTGGR